MILHVSLKYKYKLKLCKMSHFYLYPAFFKNKLIQDVRSEAIYIIYLTVLLLHYMPYIKLHIPVNQRYRNMSDNVN